jgi:O-antigen/teichoic acid export membrane protein
MELDRQSFDSVPTILVRNTGYNLLSQGILIALAIWGIPFLVHGLGGERFGLLTLLWALVGYFSLLDLGISRAITKFLSESIALGNMNLSSRIIWISLTLSAALGLISALLIVVMTPYLLFDVFKIGPAYYKDAAQSFFLAAVSIPFMLTYGTMKGIQMAFQRFDMVNWFQGGAGSIQWVGSVILVWYGLGLKEIIFLTLILRMTSVFVAFVFLPQLNPKIFSEVTLWDKEVIHRLLGFGGWVTISQIVSPVFMYLDRILIATFLTLTAVAYYSVPQEAISRLLIIPASFSMALFPVFSGQAVMFENHEKVVKLYFRSVKYMSLIIMPIAVGIIVYARKILLLWVGMEYSAESTLVFQIVACGLIFNSIAQVPTTVLHAFNRPDLTAKIHLIELPFMILMNVILIPWIGILGAAITWSIRVLADMVLLFFATHRNTGISFMGEVKGSFSHTLGFDIIGLLIFSIMIFLVENAFLKIILLVILIVMYVSWVWFRSFDQVDRNFFIHLRSRILG